MSDAAEMNIIDEYFKERDSAIIKYYGNKMFGQSRTTQEPTND